MPNPSARQQLRALLLSIFSADTLRSFLYVGPEGEEVTHELPGEGEPFKVLVDGALEVLTQRGLIDGAFFDRLRAERPSQKAAIDAVEAAWNEPVNSRDKADIDPPWKKHLAIGLLGLVGAGASIAAIEEIIERFGSPEEPPVSGTATVEPPPAVIPPVESSPSDELFARAAGGAPVQGAVFDCGGNGSSTPTDPSGKATIARPKATGVTYYNCWVEAPGYDPRSFDIQWSDGQVAAGYDAVELSTKLSGFSALIVKAHEGLQEPIGGAEGSCQEHIQRQIANRTERVREIIEKQGNIESSALQGLTAEEKGWMTEWLGKRELRFPDLSGVRLGAPAGCGADLKGIGLESADLAKADLRNADLSGADMRFVYATWINLQGANIGGASFQGADLRGADLRGAEGEPASWAGACYCEETQWGERSIPPDAQRLSCDTALDCPAPSQETPAAPEP